MPRLRIRHRPRTGAVPSYSFTLLAEMLRLCAYPRPNGAGFLYSFTLPAEMPLMMYLEKKQNATMMGTAEMATTR